MLVYLILALVVAQRLGELWLAGANTRRLLASGGIEIGRSHYPLFILLHASWLVAIVAMTPATTVPHPLWFGLYIALQFGRAWVIASLGPYWTTRIITMPGVPLVRRGPYRFVRHPNYWVASLELAVLPLMFDQVWIAVVWSVLNALLIAWRVRVEDGALAPRRTGVAVRD